MGIYIGPPPMTTGFGDQFEVGQNVERADVANIQSVFEHLMSLNGAD
jgi:hypothetical protein